MRLLVIGLAGCASASEPTPTVLCGGGRTPCTDVRFVAHEDDDLLFMNPDIAASIATGNRVVTVFVTAGTATDPARMAMRERGMLNAYAEMVAPEYAVTAPESALLPNWSLAGGAPIELGPQRAIQYDFLPSAGQLSLVFLRVVEESAVDLRALVHDEVAEVATVPCATDCVLGSVLAAQRYTKDQLLATLGAIMQRFAADAVATLDATGLHYREEGYGLGWLDHADHLATAELAVAAFERYAGTATLDQYRAYNTGCERANVADATAKRRTFYRYMVLGEGLAGSDGEEYTNRDPEDPHFANKAYEAWTARRYVVSSLPPASGQLEVSGSCLVADLTLGACADAPDWELTPAHSLRGAAGCVELAADGSTHVAECLPGEAQRFVLTTTGQLRTRGANCLEADAAGVRAASCAKAVDRHGDPIGRPVISQQFRWR